MLDAFINNNKDGFCFINNYQEEFRIYQKILGYDF